MYCKANNNSISVSDYSEELNDSLEEPDILDCAIENEGAISDAFRRVRSSRSEYYNYLILDSEKICRLQKKNEPLNFETFVEAVIYVGKGKLKYRKERKAGIKSQRSYVHIRDACKSNNWHRV